MTINPVHFTSKSDRWFTPPDLERDIRAFLGGDYFDPCPARVEGEPIESGLWQRWHGRVYCNPPYGRVHRVWIQKALGEMVDELLLLVPARTSAAWFQPLFDYTLCFIRGRLRFSGATVNAPFDSVLVYRGPRMAEFVAAFGPRGRIMRAAENGGRT